VRYSIYEVSPLLQDEIRCFWSIDAAPGEKPHTERVYATGATQMLFHYGVPFVQSSGGTSIIQPVASFAGQYSSFFDVSAMPGAGMFGIVFTPFGIRRFCTMPMMYASDRILEFTDLFPADRDIPDRICSAADNERRRDIIENFLLSHRRQALPENYTTARHAVRIIETGRDIAAGAPLHRELELSERQLERIFNDFIGFAPREFIKISRINRAIRLLPSYTRLTDVALECGFFDQSHFIRSFKSVTGLTPKQFKSFGEISQ